MKSDGHEGAEMKRGVRLVRSGVFPERRELGDFIQRLDKGIGKIARRVLRDRCVDAEDKAVIVTEMLMRKFLQDGFEGYDENRPLWPWVAWKVWMSCRELLRREGHRRELREKKQYRIARENPFKDPAEAAAQREIQQLVREEIARLPKHYRVAVKARDIHEWSRERTARLCKVPLQTISNWQFQGRLLLAKRMTRDYWGDEAKSS